MLKYFRRENGRRKNSDAKYDENGDVTDSTKRNSLRSTSSFCEEIFLEEEFTNAEDEDVTSVSGALSISTSSADCVLGEDEDIFKYHSRLSMSLHSIVNDPDCLSFFLQYLEAKNELGLIKFYLDIENFKNATKLQLIEKSENQTNFHKHKSSSENEVKPIIESAIKEEKTNYVPEFKTICDLSMRKPLTDDEKSKIYAETNKQINKCNNCNQKSSSELSLCSESTTSIELDDEKKAINDRLCDPSIRDAIAIYKKYLIADAKYLVALPVMILSEISLVLCKDSGYNDDVDTSILKCCFDEAQNYVLEKLEENFLNEFQQSTFYCKYCIELLENDAGNRTQKLTIYDILHSEVTLFFFMEYLEQHGERDCLDFWTAAINFRKGCTVNTNSRNELESQADAMIIYDKFFSLQSESRLWMSDKLRCRVEERICSKGNIANSFDLPLRIIGKYLEKKYFESFLKSQLFENYLIELKNKILQESITETVTNKSEISAPINPLQKSKLRRSFSLNEHGGHRKTFSECSNERSNEAYKHISQHNTLLASMDSSHLKNIQATGANLNIDSRQLTDPQLLWRRTVSTEGGLKFGYVNSLGRYERDFENVESINNSLKHNWTLNLGGNKIKNVMRKLVNLPEAKVQEEIAWQVAEMIVKDVTRVTLNNSKTVYKK